MSKILNLGRRDSAAFIAQHHDEIETVVYSLLQSLLPWVVASLVVFVLI